MQDYIKKFKKIIVLLCISIIAGGVIMGDMPAFII